MQVGFIGAGNMARALARGWGDPVLCTDSGSGRARGAGGGARRRGASPPTASSPSAPTSSSSPTSPRSSRRSREEIAGAREGRRLAPRAHAAGRRARRLPGHAGVPRRAEHAVEVAPRRARLRRARRAGRRRRAARRCTSCSARLGTVVDVPERADARRRRDCRRRARLLGAARRGVGRRRRPARHARRQVASTLVTETMAGTAALLRAREHDTLALRRAVTSPGGTTARGLAALERGGVRAALAAGDGRRGGRHDRRRAARTEIADFLGALISST